MLDLAAMMTSKTLCGNEVIVGGRRASRLAWLMPVVAVTLSVAGCRQPVDIPSTEVKTVEAYGVTLDELARPEQVAFVLLHSIHDDVVAAQDGERDDQKKAFQITFSLGAFNKIEERLVNGLGDRKNEGLGEMRDKRIYDVINRWAPIVAHYVDSFDLNESTAVKKMRTLVSNDDSSCIVLYDVCHDPTATDPAMRQPATIEITLTRERASEGTQEFWRVARVAFRGPQAKASSRPATQEVPSSVPISISRPADQ